MGVSTPWSVKDLSPLFLGSWRRAQTSSISHSLPFFTIRCRLFYVPCCLFWTQIGHAQIRVGRSKSL